MEFGIQFFPDVGPATKPADVYFAECLELVGHVDALGYSHVRTVEHYFEDYGGYSPNPIVFLTAAAMRSAMRAAANAAAASASAATTSFAASGRAPGSVSSRA